MDDQFRPIVSVCSPKKPPRSRHNDAMLTDMSEDSVSVEVSKENRNRWEDTMDLMDFDDLPLVRAIAPSDDEEHAPVLTLNFFVQNPVIEFPPVLPSKSRKMPLKLENPKGYSQIVQFKRCPTNKGFHILPTGDQELSVCRADATSDDKKIGSSSGGPGIYEMRVPAASSMIQYIQFVPPSTAKGGDAFREVWFCWVDTSYWVKITLIAKVLEGPKKKKVTAIWNKEPKFPVMPRGKHRTALTRIENQSECSEKKSQKIPNVDEKQDVQDAHHEASCKSSNNETEDTAAKSIDNDSKADDPSMLNLRSERNPSGASVTQTESRTNKSNLGKILPNLHKGASKKITLKRIVKRRSSSVLDSPIRSQSPRFTQKQSSTSGATGRSSSCTSTVPAKKTKFTCQESIISKLATKRSSPKVSQRVLDLSRFRRNQRKDKVVCSADPSGPMSPSVQLSGYMFFDDTATHKQLYAFQNWLNDLFLCHLNVSSKQSVGSISWLSDQRVLTQTKQKLLFILRSQEVSTAILAVEKDIHEGRISIRPDIKLIFDLALRKKLVGLVMNINAVWLSLVLEIVFGDCVPPLSPTAHNSKQSTNWNTISSRADLEKFLESHFISRSDLDTTRPSQYSLHLQSSEGGAAGGVLGELHRHILRKFFLLVILIDRAKLAKVIAQDPCLFNVESEIKSTNVLVCQFCRLCLKSEGSIIRHLANLNYFLHFEQKALDEYSFFVENIETDLRDGVKLVKALELANGSSGQKWVLMKQLRYPAEARTRKLHNVSVAMNNLATVMKVGRVVDFNGHEITPKDIVDGNNAKTAALLWHMCMDLKVCLNLISAETVRNEIKRISYFCDVHTTSFEDTRSDALPVADWLMKWALLIGCNVISDLDELHAFDSGNSGVTIKDACPGQCCPLDGVLSSVVMCSVVSFYLPQLLGKDDVILSNVVTCKDPISAMQQNLELFSSAVSHIGGIPNLIQAPLLSGSAVPTSLDASMFTFCETPSKLDSAGIGGSMKKPTVTVDRKVFLLMLASLFTRLTLIRKENEAACKIQHLWQTYRRRKKQTAALKSESTPRNDAIPNMETFSDQFPSINSQVLEAKERKLDAISTENLELSFASKEACQFNKRCTFVVNEKMDEDSDNLLLRQDSLTETGVNICMADQPQTMEPSSVENGQQEWREDVSNTAASVIQRWYRNILVGKKSRQEFVRIKSSVAIIQNYWREYCSTRRYKQLVISIQAASRAYLVRKDLFSEPKSAAVLFKVHTRLNKRSLRHLKKANTQSLGKEKVCLELEEPANGSKIRNTLPEEYAEIPKCNDTLATPDIVASGDAGSDVVACFTYFKYFNYQWERLEPFIRNYAAGLISHYLSCYLKALNIRRKFITTKGACIVLQKCIRKWLVVRRQQRQRELEILWQLEFLELQKQQELLLQQQRRQHEQNVKQSKAALKIQLFLRSLIVARKCREDFLRKRSAVIKLQAFFRGNIAAKRYLKTRSAVFTISRWYRTISLTRKTRAQYLSVKIFIVALQSRIRGYQLRNNLQLQTQSAVIIQTNLRRYLQKQKYLACKAACVKIQRWWREKHAKMAEQKALAEKLALEKSAIVFTQNLIRGFIARTQFARRTEINKCVKDVFVQIRSAVIIQRAFRKARPKLLLWYYRTKLHKAATKIQCLWRGYCLRRDLGYFIENVVIVQRAFRRYQCCKAPKEHFRRCRNAAIIIQKTYRGHLVRKTSTVSVMRKAVNVISEFYIKYKDEHFRKKSKETAAIKIQSAWRGYWVRNSNQLEAHAHGFSSGSCSSSTTNHSHESTAPAHPTSDVILKDSALVTSSCDNSAKRGKKTTNKARRLSQIWHNLRQIDPETLTLQARMDAGLACLLNMTMVSKIIPILSEIETCTRWSETCCIRFTTPSFNNASDVIKDKNDVMKGSTGASAAVVSKGEKKAVKEVTTTTASKPTITKKELHPRRSEPIQVLLDLMDRCCRSIADQDILLIAVTILINLAKVKTCQLDLRHDQELVRFLLVMLTKNNPSACKGTVASKLYCHTCFLLQILVTFKQCIKVAEESFREIDKLRNQYRIEMAKQKNSSKNNPASLTGKSGKKAKPAFDFAHLHPEWELCQKRTKPATNVVSALESLLMQLRVPMLPR